MTGTLAINRRSVPAMPGVGFCDQVELENALRLLVPEGEVVEIRIFEAKFNHSDYRGQKQVGYFNDIDRLVAEVSNVKRATGAYLTLNSIEPKLLARTNNQFKPGEKDAATSDSHVLRRRWLLIDCDAVRVTGISSSEPEHAAAALRAEAVELFLHDLGWPDPIRADSGNGYHLLYHIDEPAKDDGLVERVLKSLDEKFTDDKVKIDTSVANPARICRLYGTRACKGADMPDRPHRMSRIVDAPETPQVVPTRLLEELAASAPETKRVENPSGGGLKSFDLDGFLARHTLDVVGPYDWQGGRKWTFNSCPMCEHNSDGPFLIQFANGAICAGCHHDSCKGRWVWADLRERYEPRATRVAAETVSTQSPAGNVPNRIASTAGAGAQADDLEEIADRDAERDVARVLVESSREQFAAIKAICSADDFVDRCFRELYRSVDKMHEVDVPIAKSTVLAWLRQKPAFRNIDEVQWFDQLTARDTDIAPDRRFELALHQAGVVADKARKRSLDETLKDGRAALRNCKPAGAVWDGLMVNLNGLRVAEPSKQPTTREMVRTCVEGVLQRTRPPMFSAGPTDSLFHKDLVIGRRMITMVGAPSGFGKSAIAHQWVFDAMLDPEQGDLRVLIASTEMSLDDIVKRQISRLSGVPHHQITNGTFAGEARVLIEGAGEELAALADRYKVIGFDSPFTIEAIEREAEAFNADLVLIDYLQLLLFEDRDLEERQRLDALTPRIRALANSGEQGRAIIAISSLNRQGYDPASAGLHSFRGSGSIEYTSDSAYLIIGDPQDRSAGRRDVTLRCCKSRNGPTGEWRAVFEPRYMTFTASPDIPVDADLAEFATDSFYGDAG
jgi:replicative DNA helicase